MLPRLVLLVVQLAAAWFLADTVRSILSPIVGRQYDIFLYAVIYAAIIMIVGFAGSLVLKNVRVPTVGTFTVSLLFALILAAAIYVDQVRTTLDAAIPLLRGNAKVYPLVGAMLGYILKR